MKTRAGEEILHVDAHVEIRSYDENETYEVILDSSQIMGLPKTPGRDLDDFNDNIEMENENEICIFNPFNIGEAKLNLENRKMKKIRGKENVSKNIPINKQRKNQLKLKKGSSGMIKIDFPKRPVMEPTSNEEINEYLKNMNGKYPIIETKMKHSLRFWLAVKISVLKKRKTLPISNHFGVKVSNVNRAIKQGKEPKDVCFLSPGEFCSKNFKQIVRMYGRSEDREKYLATNFVFKQYVADLKARLSQVH